MSSLLDVYDRLSVTFKSGQGCFLYDDLGRDYLDAISGISVCGLGHCHPTITETIIDQSKQLIHTSNLYGIEHQSTLADQLTGLSQIPQAKTFFCNSGAEANEAALKMTRLYAQQKGIKDPLVVVMDNAFHGRTFATLSATSHRKVRAGFEPLLSGFIRIPFNDIDALKQVADTYANIVAVMLEPIQCEGGINIPLDTYLPAVRDLCENNDWLMVLDEVQTGMGRTGTFLAWQQFEMLPPHIVTMAKALGNGLPIGACLFDGELATLMGKGKHGSTFGGNPLVTAVALSVIQETNRLLNENLVQKKVNFLSKHLNIALSNHPQVIEVRQQGLIIGIELIEPKASLMEIALNNGLLITVVGEKTIRLLPPLIISENEIELLIDRLIHTLNAC